MHTLPLGAGVFSTSLCCPVEEWSVFTPCAWGCYNDSDALTPVDGPRCWLLIPRDRHNQYPVHSFLSGVAGFSISHHIDCQQMPAGI